MRHLPLTLLVTVFIGGCGGSVLADAEAKAAAACECQDPDCVRPYVIWFDETSRKDGGAALDGLSDDDKAKYKEFSLKAGDCQVKIKSGS